RSWSRHRSDRSRGWRRRECERDWRPEHLRPTAMTDIVRGAGPNRLRKRQPSWSEIRHRGKARGLVRSRNQLLEHAAPLLHHTLLITEADITQRLDMQVM